MPKKFKDDEIQKIQVPTNAILGLLLRWEKLQLYAMRLKWDNLVPIYKKRFRRYPKHPTSEGHTSPMFSTVRVCCPWCYMHSWYQIPHCSYVFKCFRHPFERQQSLESHSQKQNKQLKHCNPAKALRPSCSQSLQIIRTSRVRFLLNGTLQQTNIAGWKMDPDWRWVFHSFF